MAPAVAKVRRPVVETGDLLATLNERVLGQASSLASIVPYVEMYQAGLSPEGRPAGVFLLLGPTGTGKTHTVEALAEAIHGSKSNLLRVDCGEYQLDHEVAKLIGAPPGYLGHRETVPFLTQNKINANTSERSNLSIVLFDEIEKAAPSLTRLLLGVLDRATLHLGDNGTVNFERCLIFMTSNLGARAIANELRPTIGFESLVDRPIRDYTKKLESVATHAVKKHFSPEFVNRIDVINTYQPLEAIALNRILDQLIDDFQRTAIARLGSAVFILELSRGARDFLIKRGTSIEYGARELRRTLQRYVIQPVASLVSRGLLEPGGVARVTGRADSDVLAIKCCAATL